MSGFHESRGPMAGSACCSGRHTLRLCPAECLAKQSRVCPRAWTLPVWWLNPFQYLVGDSDEPWWRGCGCVVEMPMTTQSSKTRRHSSFRTDWSLAFFDDGLRSCALALQTTRVADFTTEARWERFCDVTVGDCSIWCFPSIFQRKGRLRWSQKVSMSFHSSSSVGRSSLDHGNCDEGHLVPDGFGYCCLHEVLSHEIPKLSDRTRQHSTLIDFLEVLCREVVPPDQEDSVLQVSIAT